MEENVFHYYYSNIPCQGKDCVYWAGEYTEEKTYPKGYSKNTGIYSKEMFTSIWHGEHCEKSQYLAQLRKSICDRAIVASDSVHMNGKYKNIKVAIRKASEELYKVYDEWRNMKCPFYNTGENNG